MEKKTGPGVGVETEVEFYAAIGSGARPEIDALLASMPALVNSKNEHGISPIMWALYNRQAETALHLREVGCNPDAFEACALGDRDGVVSVLDSDEEAPSRRTTDGFTLLHLACFFGHEELAAVLIESGSDVNSVADNPSKVAPVHSAAAGGSVATVDRLLKAGAHADATQEGGFTALMSAAMQGNLEMVKTLMAAGASPDIAAADGRTAIGIATASEREDLLALLAPDSAT